MLRRRLVLPILLLLLLAAAGIGASVYAQLETTDRGILPLETAKTLAISGVHVDASGEDGQSARLNGFRMAQRQGFKALWAKMHNQPASRAPNLPDGTLDQIVTSINVDREEIGPNRYIADLSLEFDRARSAPFLGAEGSEITEHSVPMLLIPVLVTGGTETSVEVRNAWQRSWAQFRTAQSPINYVRVSGMGADPLLVNAAQVTRPGRGWWRALLEMYSAQDILVAEVQLQHAYPGGPARARFIARHGPDAEIIGGFTLTAANDDAVAGMLVRGTQQMDALFARALAAGQLSRDPSLNVPTPPVIELPPLETAAAPAAPKTVAANSYQVQVSGNDVAFYNFAMAHLRTLPGITSATPQQINPSGTSYILVQYRGSAAQLAAALNARGWSAAFGGTVVSIRSSTDRPPGLPALPPATPAPTPAPPPQPAPPAQQPATNESGALQ